MTGPQFAPVDQDTADLLSLIAGDPRHDDDRTIFLAACEQAAQANDGHVYVNDVRHILSNRYGLTIEPRRYSALWSSTTGPGKPMRKLPGQWTECVGSATGNDGKPQPVRVWTGLTP